MRVHIIRNYNWDIVQNLPSKNREKIGLTNNGNTIYGFKIVNSPSAPYIFLSGTVHGNEPAGALALTKFLKEDLFNDKKSNFIIIPCVNPDGYESGLRENAKNIDLNRDFSDDPKSIEVKLIKDYLKSSNVKFTRSVDFHESGREELVDEECAPDNFYMWELNKNKSTRIAHKVIDRLYKEKIPTCNWPTIFGDVNNNGAIFYPENCFSEEYSEAKSFDVFMEKYYTDSAITTETSVHDPLPYRIKTLEIILRTIKDGK